MRHNETYYTNLKEEKMRIPFITSNREYKAQARIDAADLAHHKKMMEAISEASKNGMKPENYAH